MIERSGGATSSRAEHAGLPDLTSTQKKVYDMIGTIGALFSQDQMPDEGDRRAAVNDIAGSATVLLEGGNLQEVGEIIGKLVTSGDVMQRRHGIAVFATLFHQAPDETRRKLPELLGLKFSKKLNKV